jgi:outer membrane protein
MRPRLSSLQSPLGASAPACAGGSRAGANLTVAWEKSGTLDSTDRAGSVGPAVQVGVDWELSSRALLNLDVRWNRLTAELENGGTPLAKLRIDPLSLGIGVGFRFQRGVGG